MVARPGRPICSGKIDTRGSQALLPGDDGFGLEAELGDHVDRRVGASREGVLPGEGTVDCLVGDLGAALRVTGDTDAPDTEAIQ